MPAPPYLDYVFCPDGTTAIGDNCGSTMPLYQQEAIAYAKIQSDPVFQAAVEAERPRMALNPDQGGLPTPPLVSDVKKGLDTKTIFIILGLGLLAYYLINKKD